MSRRFVGGRRGAFAAALVLAAPLAACSDDGTSMATPTTPTTASTTSTSTTTTSAPADGTAEPTEEPSPLDGTAWLLRSIDDGGDAVEASEHAVPAVITFGADSIDVYDGVNTVSGSYELDGAEVGLEMGRATDFPYPDEDLPQYEFIERLATVERATLEGGTLVLVQRDGARMTLEQALGVSPSG